MKTNKELGEKLLHNLIHTVGYPHFYRNHYCAEIGGDVEKEFEILCAMQLAEKSCYANEGKSCYFHLTEAGVEFLRFLYHGNYTENLL